MSMLIKTSSVDFELWCRSQLTNHCFIWLDTQALWPGSRSYIERPLLVGQTNLWDLLDRSLDAMICHVTHCIICRFEQAVWLSCKHAWGGYKHGLYRMARMMIKIHGIEVISRKLVKRAICGCLLVIVLDCFFDPDDANHSMLNIQLARMASTASTICIFFKLVSTLWKSLTPLADQIHQSLHPMCTSLLVRNAKCFQLSILDALHCGIWPVDIEMAEFATCKQGVGCIWQLTS